MTTYPNSPKILKGGLVLLDPASARVRRIISLQYNPEQLTRSLQVQTIRLEADIDAADQLEFPQENRTTVEYGIQPQLAMLEALAHPSSEQLFRVDREASGGTLEITPMEAPLLLFVWSKNRIVPVRLTEFSVTEKAFDVSLNPLLATISLGMRVLSVDDLGFAHKGGSLFMSYLQTKEQLAAKAKAGSFGAIGIGGIG
jgi:hypothetical protein